MKDVNEVRDLLKILKSTEIEAHRYINDLIPEVGESLVSKLFDLIVAHGSDFRLGLHPEIDLNIEDSAVYLRILPIEAGSRISNSAERSLLFPSFSLHELFKVKECELYSWELRDKICYRLSEEIKQGLKSIKVRSKVNFVYGSFYRQVRSYKVVLKF